MSEEDGNEKLNNFSIWGTKKIIVGVFLMIALIVGMRYFAMLEAGYCPSQQRYLTDEELIIPAIRKEVINRVTMTKMSDAEAKDFFKSHPNCCSVDRHPLRRIPFLDVISGFNNSEVEVNYERQASEEDIKKFGKYYKAWVSVEACGRAIKTEYGTITETLENAANYK